MLKWTALIAVICATATVWFASALSSATRCDTVAALDVRSVDHVAVARQAQEIDAQRLAHGSFAEFRDDRVRALAGQQISLMEACEAVREQALATFPSYLQHVQEHFAPMALKHALARRLLAHVEDLRDPRAGEVKRALEEEMTSDAFLAWRRQPWRNLDDSDFAAAPR